ncbi:platelet-derived growth factor D isoform X1 [Amblyraja radiata]|uniref:platelet-derived growth factor D isoform X1 n=1 Tax=Amblyraja radiata TaxID=386614 RepID=UPI001401ECEE|nr:platelet-derived growth factor D isoform X1 [Amblyraja radiata]XP_032878560.1 platelet-derived growth factor D isoform X1 [Amblyraja radiata]
MLLLFTLVIVFADFGLHGIKAQGGSIKALRSSTIQRDESNHLTAIYRHEDTVNVVNNGYVQSPRFPLNYPRSILLTWKLLSPENTRIQLVFDTRFGLEDPENDICRYDFVEVEDMSDTSRVIRGRWCGSKEVPPRLTSKSNRIRITFKSDEYFVAKPGFRIYYSPVEVEDLQPQTSKSNWEAVTSSILGSQGHHSSATASPLTAESLDEAIASFDTIEELLRHLNPDFWEDDLNNIFKETPQFRGRTFHHRERKTKVDLNRMNNDVKRYSCTPRNYSVNLREELKQTNAVFFPRCLLVQRCGGNCACGTEHWGSCNCMQAKTVMKYHSVLRFIPEPGKSRKRNMSLVDIQLEHHERCDCICSSRPPR